MLLVLLSGCVIPFPTIDPPCFEGDYLGRFEVS